MTGANFARVLAISLLMPALALLGGCGDSASERKSESTDKEKSSDISVTKREPDATIEVKRTDDIAPSVQDRIRSGTLGNGTTQVSRSLGGAKAIERLAESLRESLQLTPATIVWLWDVSDNCEPFGEPMRHAVLDFYKSLETSPAKNELATGLITFGEDIDMPLGDAVESTPAVIEALEAITFDGGDAQLTFGALNSCLDRFLKPSRDAGHDLLVVCITNEAGSDQAHVDEVTDRFADAAVPVYVIGLAAPFGLVGTESISRVGTETTGLECGPESFSSERVRLAYPPNAQETLWLDSGFGSWGLERLCRTSGGRYLIVRDLRGRFSGGVMGGNWPSVSARRFSDQTMSRYKPEYVSEEEYMRRTESNAARKALYEAAQLEHSAVLQYVGLEFDATNPAQLNNAAARAQRDSAAVIPRLERLRNLLQSGESERDQLTSPRLQAGFDLAMGRAYAALTRADGYNNMLAELKRGKNFTDPENDTWVLVQADEFTSGGSRLKNGLKRAQEYLQRVIDEHPDTPWAHLAQQELNTPIGWQWTEENRKP